MTSTPLRAGEFASDLNEVGSAIVDGARAEPLARGALRVRTGRRQDRRPERPRQLNRRRTDAARAAVDEDGLAFGELPAIEEVGPDREERLWNRGGLARPEPAGQRQRLRFRHDAVLGVAAAGDERADAVAFAPARDVGTDSRHGARNFEARQIRNAWWRRVLAEPLQNVRTVDARRFDAHQKLSRARRGCRPIDQAQHFWSTGSRDLNRSHRRVHYLSAS